MQIEVVREFLRRLAHPVALVGLKPIGRAAKSSVLWPIDIDDAADEACSLSRQYFNVYCNLNCLASYMLEVRPDEGRSVNDRMIVRHLTS